MSNGLNKPSVRSQARDAVSRIQKIEDSVASLVQGLNQVLEALDKRLGMTEEVVEASILLLGPEAVQETLKTERSRRASDLVAMQKLQLETGLKEGWVSPTEEVSSESIIVAREVNANGEEFGPGYVQVEFQKLTPQSQSLLLGRKVGEVVPTPGGGTFTVLGVYLFDREKQIALIREAKAKEASEKAKGLSDLPDGSTLPGVDSVAAQNSKQLEAESQ